ncbi:hypothetical protein BCR43DRAFT_491519 [Syncephalastrum racemosum]|uniref:Centromere protein H C-terminal domain-containing protein n=1 Tax=Syncephalastrum racemosum TaxID=13706 RepID=A0A1X2HDC2_SYNRA|nr:hypothetical protein BCR43DRAFT_491519 [Syncephalastrum racemosum]
MTTPSVLTNKERFLLASQAEIDWLEAQIKQYEIDLADTPLTEQDDTEEIQTNPRDAQRIKLEALIQYNLNTASIGRNLDSAMLAFNSLFPKDADEDNLKRSRAVESLIEERDQVTVEVMALLSELREARYELGQVQARSRQVQQSNRETLKAIREAQERHLADTDEASTQTNDDLALQQSKESLEKLEMSRNALMGLILESNIDWTNNKRWRETMLMLGDELEM